MKPTHIFKHEDKSVMVRAWQYVEDAPMPVWVFRNFHSITQGKLSGGRRVGFIEVALTDWIISLENDGYAVMADEEFKKHATPL